MARVKRGVTTRAKHKNILSQAKGYYGRRKNTIRIARQAVEKAGCELETHSTMTGVPISAFSKNFFAMSAGRRTQPWEAA